MGYVRKAVCNTCGTSKSESNKWLGGTLQLLNDGGRPAQFEALVLREEDVVRWSERAREQARLWCGVPCLLKDMQAVLGQLGINDNLAKVVAGDSADSTSAKPRTVQ